MKKPPDQAISHPSVDEGSSLAQAAGKCKSTTDIIDLLEQTATLWGVSPRALWPMVLPEIQCVDWPLLVHLVSLEKRKDQPLKPRGPNPTLVKAWLTPALAPHIEQAMIAEYDSLVSRGDSDSDTTTWAL